MYDWFVRFNVMNELSEIIEHVSPSFSFRSLRYYVWRSSWHSIAVKAGKCICKVDPTGGFTKRAIRGALNRARQAG